MNQTALTQVEDRDTSLLATELVVRAMDDHEDAPTALLTLLQAAGALCLTKISPAIQSLAMFDAATTLTRQRLEAMLGVTAGCGSPLVAAYIGETRQ